MSTDPAAVLTLAVLAVAGLAPVLALVGLRLVSIPLCPLAGAVIAALAATADTAVGGGLLAWFVGLAAVAMVAVGAVWMTMPARRPWAAPGPDGDAGPGGGNGRPTGQGVRSYLAAGLVGGVAVVVAIGWGLRGLATPTVGFDARAVWVMRAGWFLQSHQQLLIKLRVPDVILIQSAYPPLVSAAASLAWRVAGDQSVRLGVVVIALLNACALAVAAFALVEAGRRVAWRLSGTVPEPVGPVRPADVEPVGPVEPADTEQVAPVHRRRAPSLPWVPMAVGVVVAVLLVLVAAGITEPFLTNGYADPIWSLAALGAVAYGLQMAMGRSDQGAALILILVAGLSKNEGLVVAVALVVLVGVRAVVTLSAEQRRRRHWVRPVVTAVVELAVLGTWPLLMRVIHARGESTTFSPLGQWGSRADATFHGFAPYLHVLVLALPVAVVGGLALSGLRRRTGLANDLWAWAGLVCGLVAVGGALVVGTGAILPWLETTVHRITEFSAMEGWWIIAVWAVVASGALVPAGAGLPFPITGAMTGAGSGAESDSGSDSGAPAPHQPLTPATP
jgi:hypothetical protein